VLFNGVAETVKESIGNRFYQRTAVLGGVGCDVIVVYRYNRCRIVDIERNGDLVHEIASFFLG
jgi:hypothetical protein